MAADAYWILDAKGRLLGATALEWLGWSRVHDRSIAVGAIGPGAVLSTCYVGHDKHGRRPPLLWESMVVGGTRHGEVWAWASAEEARAGHERILGLLRDELG